MKKILILIGIILLAGATFVAFKMFQPLPEGLNLATTQTTTEGHYVVAISPEDSNYQRNTLHSWIVEVKTPDGAPVQDAAITIDGGMPQHGHGLPTSPQMTKTLGDGRYKIEGVRFSMRGWWEFKLTISARGTTDTITFNLVMN